MKAKRKIFICFLFMVISVQTENVTDQKSRKQFDLASNRPEYVPQETDIENGPIEIAFIDDVHRRSGTQEDSNSLNRIQSFDIENLLSLKPGLPSQHALRSQNELLQSSSSSPQSSLNKLPNLSAHESLKLPLFQNADFDMSSVDPDPTYFDSEIDWQSLHPTMDAEYDLPPHLHPEYYNKPFRPTTSSIFHEPIVPAKPIFPEFDDPRHFEPNPCQNANALQKLLSRILMALLRSMNNGNPELDTINDILDTIKSQLNSGGLQDVELYPKLQGLEKMLRQGFPSNTLGPVDSRTKIIFKDNVPKIEQPDCNAAFLKLMAVAYDSYVQLSKYPNCKSKTLFADKPNEAYDFMSNFAPSQIPNSFQNHKQSGYQATSNLYPFVSSPEEHILRTVLRPGDSKTEGKTSAEFQMISKTSSLGSHSDDLNNNDLIQLIERNFAETIKNSARTNLVDFDTLKGDTEKSVELKPYLLSNVQPTSLAKPDFNLLTIPKVGPQVYGSDASPKLSAKLLQDIYTPKDYIQGNNFVPLYMKNIHARTPRTPNDDDVVSLLESYRPGHKIVIPKSGQSEFVQLNSHEEQFDSNLKQAAKLVEMLGQKQEQPIQPNFASVSDHTEVYRTVTPLNVFNSGQAPSKSLARSKEVNLLVPYGILYQKSNSQPGLISYTPIPASEASPERSAVPQSFGLPLLNNRPNLSSIPQSMNQGSVQSSLERLIPLSPLGSKLKDEKDNSFPASQPKVFGSVPSQGLKQSPLSRLFSILPAGNQKHIQPRYQGLIQSLMTQQGNQRPAPFPQQKLSLRQGPEDDFPSLLPDKRSLVLPLNDEQNVWLPSHLAYNDPNKNMFTDIRQANPKFNNPTNPFGKHSQTFFPAENILLNNHNVNDLNNQQEDGDSDIFALWVNNHRNQVPKQTKSQGNVNIFLSPQCQDFSDSQKSFLLQLLKYYQISSPEGEVSNQNRELLELIITYLKAFLRKMNDPLATDQDRTGVDIHGEIDESFLQYIYQLIQSSLPNAENRLIAFNKLKNFIKAMRRQGKDLSKQENLSPIVDFVQKLISELLDKAAHKNHIDFLPTDAFEGANLTPSLDKQFLKYLYILIKNVQSDQEQIIVIKRLKNYINELISRGYDLDSKDTMNLILQYLKQLISLPPSQVSTSGVPKEFDILPDENIRPSNILNPKVLNMIYNLITDSVPPSYKREVLVRVKKYIDELKEQGLDLSKPENTNLILKFVYTIISQLTTTPAESPKITSAQSTPKLKHEFLRKLNDLIESSVQNGEQKEYVIMQIKNYIQKLTEQGLDLNKSETLNLIFKFVKVTLSKIPNLPTSQSKPFVQRVNPEFLEKLYNFISSSVQSNEHKDFVIKVTQMYIHNLMKQGVDLSLSENLKVIIQFVKNIISGLPTEPPSQLPSSSQQINPQFLEKLYNFIVKSVKSVENRELIISEVKIYIQKLISHGVDMSKAENLKHVVEFTKKLIASYINESNDEIPTITLPPSNSEVPQISREILTYAYDLIHKLIINADQKEKAIRYLHGYIKWAVKNNFDLSNRENMNQLIIFIIGLVQNPETSGLPNSTPEMVDMPPLTPKTVEITYTVSTKLHFGKEGVVKYRVPYNTFVGNLRNILLRKPVLRSQRKKLEDELSYSSNITEVSPELQEVPKDQLIKLIARSGSFVDAKIPEDDNNKLGKGSGILESTLQFEKMVHDLDEIINNHNVNIPQINDLRSGENNEAVATNSDTLMKKYLIVQHDSFSGYDPIAYIASSPFFRRSISNEDNSEPFMNNISTDKEGIITDPVNITGIDISTDINVPIIKTKDSIENITESNTDKNILLKGT